jgi:hypothetical protein
MNNSAQLITRFARKFQRTGSVLALVICAVLSFAYVTALATASAAYNLLARNPVGMAPVALGVTLTTPVLLLDVISAFVKEFPLIGDLAAEFRGTPLKKNQKYTAQIASYGAASTYDNTTGYANGANTARNGLIDVPVVTDVQPTYPLKWLHLDAIKDLKMQYEKVMAGAGYVLGKKVVDDGVFAKCTSRYFSYEVTKAVADCDYDWLQELVTQGNSQGMENIGRILVVNSAVAQVLGVDPRMISKEYAGQLQDGRAYREWRGVSGFARIIEYPDLPANNATALTGVTGANAGDLMTKAAHGLETGDPVTFVSGTTFTGLTAGTRYYAIKASSSTFQVALTYALARAGTAVALSADGTDGVFHLQENLTAMMFDKRAFAYLQGSPEGIDGEHARALGIPQTLAVEPVTSPNGVSMAAAKFQEAATGNYFWVPTFIFGTNAGKQADTAVAENTAAANSILAAASARDVGLDKAGLRVTSGASAS